MHSADVASAARSIIDNLDLADYDEEFEFYQALVADEAFGAACLRYENAVVYATHDDAVEADREARDCLKRSIREHAQRVRGELQEEGADD